ncbi:hypothetical protein N9948_00660 [bacterium]|nr:hypothetical protein [bacterium]
MIIRKCGVLILGILLTIVSTDVFAEDCQEILLNGYQDSHSHQIRVDDIVIDDSLRFISNFAIRRLLRKSGCEIHDLKQTTCGYAVKGNPRTEVCYSDSQYGYYIVQRDYLYNINIIVNRWD